MLAHARLLPWTQEQLVAALHDAMEAHASVLYPFGEDNPLTDAEREVLRQGGADLTEHSPSKDDALLRSKAEFAAILASALTTAEAARRLGVSDMRIRQRITARSLIGVQTPRGWRIPSFQFAASGELPGWDRVARALPNGISPVEVLTWLELPHPDLRVRGQMVTPRTWLLDGRDPDEVVKATDDFANR